jgi:hypothetical protein
MIHAPALVRTQPCTNGGPSTRRLTAHRLPNACKDGLLGNLYRAKYTSTGTCAGNTNVRIDLRTDGLTASP